MRLPWNDVCGRTRSRTYSNSYSRGVIDWRIWIECEQAVWSEQRWPNRTKQGCSTQNVRISYKDSAKAVQKRQSPFPLQPLPVWGPVWSDSTPSTPTPDSIGFDQTITLTLSTLARDSPNRSCPRAKKKKQRFKCSTATCGTLLAVTLL